MSKKEYTFTSANMGDVAVYIVGDYRDDSKDVQVDVDNHSKMFEEIDGGGVDDIIKWLIEVGVEFESDRSMKFNHRYIASVMIDRDTTEQELLDDAASWTDEEIKTWKEYL